MVHHLKMVWAAFEAKIKEFFMKNSWKLTNMLFLSFECTVPVLQSAIKKCSYVTPLSNKILSGIAASLSLVIFVWACSRNEVLGYLWDKRKNCIPFYLDEEAQNPAVEQKPLATDALAIVSGLIMVAASILSFLEELKVLEQHHTTFLITLFGGVSVLFTFIILFVLRK